GRGGITTLGTAAGVGVATGATAAGTAVGAVPAVGGATAVAIGVTPAALAGVGAAMTLALVGVARSVASDALVGAAAEATGLASAEVGSGEEIWSGIFARGSELVDAPASLP